MRKSKGLKFSYLVVLFVCIATFFSGMITSVMSMSSGSMGTITSYMHDNKKLIESDFYKSRYFDVDYLGFLIDWQTSSVMDKNEKKCLFLTDKKNLYLYDTNEGDEIVLYEQNVLMASFVNNELQIIKL